MSLSERLFQVANLGAEWVLWLLLILSFVSVAIMAERLLFLRRRRANVGTLQKQLADHLDAGEFETADKVFRRHPSMEGKVLSEWSENDPLGAGMYFAPHGIAVDSRGDLYVSEVTTSYNFGKAPADWGVLRKYVRV